VWEGGVRYDAKNIQTLASGKLNMGDPSIPGGASIVPVNRFYNTVNGSLGLSLFDAKHWQWKANFSSGYRGPNLAELSSNGLHEGSVRYEIGNVNLKIEQNFCGSTYLSYRHKQFTVYVDAYANRFKNYIYLQGSDNDYYGMRIYYYLQRNALIGGVESAFTWHPQVLKQWQWQVSYNRLSGQTLFKENLPFIPAPKLNNEWRYKLPSFKGFRQVYVSFSYVYVYAQNNVSQFETASPAYHLLNASLGGEHKLGKNTLVLSVALNNLSNETYFDHLSRFKYYGINNMGRNMNINLRYQFN
jgi:iron complex outermembrane receptor protein